MKDVFPDIPTLTLSAIIILIVPEYICKLLKLRALTQLYQELLNKSNIIYMIEEIIKLKYETLALLIFDSDRVDTILKTMVFVDDIENI